ncbi:hypothetical protein CBF23_003265 [Marinomonas agarivorans]|nr:hypothetical protein CBF23_003265 [Marinomonas agarivorans]
MTNEELKELMQRRKFANTELANVLVSFEGVSPMSLMMNPAKLNDVVTAVKQVALLNDQVINELALRELVDG